MKLKLLFMALIIGLSISSCKKNNDIVLNYEVVNESNYTIQFFFYNSSGGLINVDYNHEPGKENKLFIPNTTKKILCHISHGPNSSGKLVYYLKNKVDQYELNDELYFNLNSQVFTYMFEL